MSSIKDRFNRRQLPDSTELRERILEAVEDLIDRAEQVVDVAPSPGEVARRAYPERAVKLVGTTVVAAAPTLMSAARNRIVRKNAAKALRRGVPVVVVRTHPVLAGIGLATTAAAALYTAKRLRARRKMAEADLELEAAHDRYAASSNPTHFDLEEEVMRMEDEGGEPSAGSAASTQERRFVRQGNGTRATRS